MSSLVRGKWIERQWIQYSWLSDGSSLVRGKWIERVETHYENQNGDVFPREREVD